MREGRLASSIFQSGSLRHSEINQQMGLLSGQGPGTPEEGPILPQAYFI